MENGTNLLAGRLAIFRINYKSDFILTLQSDAGWAIPFCIKFWTGVPSQAYYAGFDGTTYTNCAPVVGEPSKLQVQFDDHHLPIGELKYQIGYHFTVDDFPTTVEDEVINQGAVIIDNDGRSEKVLLDFNGETAPDIQFSLPAYANEAQRIANEQQRIENEQQRIENEQTRVGNEETRIVHEWERQRNEQTRITQEEARERAFTQMQRDSESATSAANVAATLANQKAQLAQEKAEYAQQQGDFAKAQGETAQLDHTKAAGDHQTALADHQTAAADHQIAAADHQTAEADHTRAGQDHTDIQNAIAAADLVYDISKAHASGGVLATYADLSAALGTNGANVPVERRQGGMTVKFVLSSDNKYVQFRYMLPYAGNTTAENTKFVNVTNWQGVDDEPIAGSENLVKSGGTALSINEVRSLVDGYTIKELNWSNGYINSQGVITNSQASKFTQPFILKKGEKVSIGTDNTSIAVIATTSATTLVVGDSVTPLIITPSTSGFGTYEYLATEDIKIVLCAKWSDHIVSFFNEDNMVSEVNDILDAHLRYPDELIGEFDDGYFNTASSTIPSIRNNLTNCKSAKISVSTGQLYKIYGKASTNNYYRLYALYDSNGNRIERYDTSTIYRDIPLEVVIPAGATVMVVNLVDYISTDKVLKRNDYIDLNSLTAIVGQNSSNITELGNNVLGLTTIIGMNSADIISLKNDVIINNQVVLAGASNSNVVLNSPIELESNGDSLEIAVHTTLTGTNCYKFSNSGANAASTAVGIAKNRVSVRALDNTWIADATVATTEDIKVLVKYAQKRRGPVTALPLRINESLLRR